MQLSDTDVGDVCHSLKNKVIYVCEKSSRTKMHRPIQEMDKSMNYIE